MTGQGGDILAWLEAAVAERENAARAAKSFGDAFAAGPEAPDCLYGTGDGGPYLRISVPGFEGQTEAAVAHFALYGAASVLRRCAADRKLIELHRPVILHAGSTGAAYFDTTRVCRSCEPPRQFPETAYPCPTIVAVAEGYGWTEAQR